MNIEEIQKEWSFDSKIDELNMAEETLKAPKLHSKYMNLYISAYEELVKRKHYYKMLYKLKIEYYSGELDKDTLKEKGWNQVSKRILKSDLPVYIEADEDIIKQKLKISECELKIELLESILKSIQTRGYHIKNYLDYIRFTSGG